MSPLNNEDIEEKLEKHDEQIVQLRINQGQMEQRLNNIESAIQETKTVTLQGNTLILSTLQNITSEMVKMNTIIIESHTSKENNKNTNKNKIIVALIGSGGLGYALLKFDSILNWFKN